MRRPIDIPEPVKPRDPLRRVLSEAVRYGRPEAVELTRQAIKRAKAQKGTQ